MKQLRSTPVEHPWQVEIMRGIYNDNLAHLATRPIPFRTYSEQQDWWRENRHRVSAYLYEPIECPGYFVAFIALTDRGEFKTPILAIKKEEWGKKYGREIIEDYIDKADGALAGTQLQSNAVICHLNGKVGWQVLGSVMREGGMVDLLYHPGREGSKYHRADPPPSVFTYFGS